MLPHSDIIAADGGPCPAAFCAHDGSLLGHSRCVKYLLAAFPHPAGSPTDQTAPITHLGPGRVALALSMVMLSPHDTPSCTRDANKCSLWRRFGRIR